MPTFPTLKLYYEGPSVRILQMNLYGLNYRYNGLQVTGVFDSLTYEVVRDFQTEHKLVSDGIFGSKTANAVTRFQSVNGLVMNGVVDPRTRQQMFNPNPSDDYSNIPSSLSLNS